MNKTEKNENTQAPEFRDVADFPGVDSPDIVRDLSHESQCVVLNPHPDFEYRFIRCIEGRSRVQFATERGWRDRPPGLNPHTGKLEAVKTRGHTPDLMVMGMVKALYEQRMGNKADKARERAKMVAAGFNKGPNSVDGVHATGGDLRMTKES